MGTAYAKNYLKIIDPSSSNTQILAILLAIVHSQFAEVTQLQRSVCAGVTSHEALRISGKSRRVF